MKSLFTTTLILALLSFTNSIAQDSNVYTTSAGELIFSGATITQNGQEPGGAVRFSPVFNVQMNLNMDISENFGVYTGLAIRNVGFIYDVDANTRKKIRSYNLGIPVGLKLGNLEKAFLYGGYEFELPFNYKEKTFINEQKTKFSVWFSKRTEIQHSVFVGIQLPYGANIKFKYYLSNFLKQSYSEVDSMGNTVRPYENLDVNVFYVSFNGYLFKNRKFIY